MQENLEKAKIILNKSFCFMQWQADDVKNAGGEIMGKEDIEFLLSINTSGKAHFFEKEKYSLQELLAAIETAKTENAEEIYVSGPDITKDDCTLLRKNGYFINYTGHSSGNGCEIYFSEEAYIKSQISNFQNLFGDLVGAHETNLI